MQDDNSSIITDTVTAETKDTEANNEEVDDESNQELEEEIAKRITSSIDEHKTTHKCTVCQKVTRNKTKMKFQEVESGLFLFRLNRDKDTRKRISSYFRSSRQNLMNLTKSSNFSNINTLLITYLKTLSKCYIIY